MFKFKFLLWALTKLLQRAAKANPACAAYILNKNLVFQIQTRGGIGRHFIINNGKLNSFPGLTNAPAFTMTFRNGASGFATLSAKNSKDAFLSALREEDLVITGDFVELMWFQGMTDFLQQAKA